MTKIFVSLFVTILAIILYFSLRGLYKETYNIDGKVNKEYFKAPLLAHIFYWICAFIPGLNLPSLFISMFLLIFLLLVEGYKSDSFWLKQV